MPATRRAPTIYPTAEDVAASPCTSYHDAMTCPVCTKHRKPKYPTAEDVAASPSTSYWLQDAIKAAIQRDPVDALGDAEILVAVLQRRLNLLTGRTS